MANDNEIKPNSPLSGESLGGSLRPPAGNAGAAKRRWQWPFTKTQMLVLVIGLLAASNAAQWLSMRKDPDTRPVSVVAVRQMTQAYVRKITTPQLSEQESVARANLFVAAAQDELRQLVPTNHLVLARECVLSGTMNDITPELERRVEARLAEVTSGMSDTVGSVQPGAPTSDAIGHMTASNLLSPGSSAGR